METQAHNYFAKQLIWQLGLAVDKCLMVPTSAPAPAPVQPAQQQLDALCEHPSSAAVMSALQLEDVVLTRRCPFVVISWVSVLFSFSLQYVTTLFLPMVFDKLL